MRSILSRSNYSTAR